MMLMLNLSIGSSPIATHRPTTWDPSAREPTLPYPHIASLSLAFFRASHALPFNVEPFTLK